MNIFPYLPGKFFNKNDDGSGFRAALLSGPPGIGKTTTATLVCKVSITPHPTPTTTTISGVKLHNNQRQGYAIPVTEQRIIFAMPLISFKIHLKADEY